VADRWTPDAELSAGQGQRGGTDLPAHCPPGVIWMMTRRGGRFHRLRLFHPTAG